MNKEKLEQYRKLQADTPDSILDGAPRVIELDCGVSARIAGPLDYRILSRVIDWGNKENAPIDNDDIVWIILYCVMHTTPAEIGKLWRLAKSPEKLFDAYMTWLASMSADLLIAAGEEIQMYEEELQKEMDIEADAPDSSGKKKIG